MLGMRAPHPCGIIARMDTTQTPAAPASRAPAEAPADAGTATPADPQAHPQAHLQAMADAEQSVAATDDVVAQAVHRIPPPPPQA